MWSIARVRVRMHSCTPVIVPAPCRLCAASWRPRAAWRAARLCVCLCRRTISAFNDYVRVGRIRGSEASGTGMEALVRARIGLLQRGERRIEDFDMRILTSGIYIYGLRAWGRTWPAAQLLVLRSEDMFADTIATMDRVQDFLHLDRRLPRSLLRTVKNRNPMLRKSRPSAALNRTLDDFFAPYNEQLYEWAVLRGIRFARWENATSSS